MAAGGRKSASHEDDGGAFKETGKLADGIEQENVDMIWRVGEGRASRETKTRANELFGDRVESRGMARRQDEENLRAAHCVERVDDGVIFIGIPVPLGRHGAGGDPDGLRLQTIEKRRDIGLDARRRRVEIEFEIAHGGNRFFRCARDYESARIFVRLGEDRVRPEERMAEETGGATVTGKAAVGDAAVYDEERGSGSLSFAIEVRPNFGFKNHDDGGTQASENAADHGAVIERKIKHAVPQTLCCGCAAGKGGGGEKYGEIGLLSAEAAN